MTGQVSGQEAVDYDEIQAAEDAIIDAIRARHPEEHAQILSRAEDEFVGPGPIRWGDLVWAGVIVFLAALMLIHLDELTERSQGFVLGFCAVVCTSYLWAFGASVVDRVRGGDR